MAGVPSVNLDGDAAAAEGAMSRQDGRGSPSLHRPFIYF